MFFFESNFKYFNILTITMSYFVNINTMINHGSLNLNAVRIAKQNVIPHSVSIARMSISDLFYVSNTNNTIQITYFDGANSTVLTGSLTPGAYTDTELVTEINRVLGLMLVGGVQVMTCVLTNGSFEFYDSSDKIGFPAGTVTYNKSTSLLLVALTHVEYSSYVDITVAVSGTVIGRSVVQRFNESKMAVVEINEFSANGSFAILTRHNELLETNASPTLTITNRIETIGVRVFTDRVTDDLQRLEEATKVTNSADIFTCGLGLNFILKIDI